MTRIDAQVAKSTTTRGIVHPEEMPTDLRRARENFDAAYFADDIPAARRHYFLTLALKALLEATERQERELQQMRRSHAS